MPYFLCRTDFCPKNRLKGHFLYNAYNAEQTRLYKQSRPRFHELRAVRWHLEDRTLVDGNRTVVFE